MPSYMPLPTDYSCGVIPVRRERGRRLYLVVQHKAGHWSFPKGHPDADETPSETALRELREETGLEDVELLLSPAFEEVYTFTKRSGKRVRKHVTYFLGLVDTAEVTVQPEEVSDFAWGDAATTAATLTFDEGRALLAEVERFPGRGRVRGWDFDRVSWTGDRGSGKMFTSS